MSQTTFLILIPTRFQILFNIYSGTISTTVLKGVGPAPVGPGGKKTRVVTLRPVALEFSRAAGLRSSLSRAHRDARRIHSFLLQHRSGSFRPGLRLTGKLLEQSASFFHQAV